MGIRNLGPSRNAPLRQAPTGLAVPVLGGEWVEDVLTPIDSALSEDISAGNVLIRVENQDYFTMADLCLIARYKRLPLGTTYIDRWEWVLILEHLGSSLHVRRGWGDSFPHRFTKGTRIRIVGSLAYKEKTMNGAQVAPGQEQTLLQRRVCSLKELANDYQSLTKRITSSLITIKGAVSEEQKAEGRDTPPSASTLGSLDVQISRLQYLYGKLSEQATQLEKL